MSEHPHGTDPKFLSSSQSMHGGQQHGGRVTGPVHSTAAEGAVTRTDKFGQSMPILRPIEIQGEKVPGYYNVTHESIHLGRIRQTAKGWWQTDPSWATGREASIHPDRHSAVASLFSKLDPATHQERHA